MTSSICRAACIQLNSTNDLDVNIEQAGKWVAEAAEKGAKLIALPENAFFMRKDDGDNPGHYDSETYPAINACRQWAQKFRVWILAGSFFSAAPEGKWFNRSLLIDPAGELRAEYDKIHLFDVVLSDNESYRESDRIRPGDRLSVVDSPWGKIGLSVCYDLRFPHLFRDLARKGAEILTVPAAFAYTTGIAHWHALLRARAIENGCFVLAPAQAGTHPGGRRTFGHSLIVGPWGEILAEADGETPGIILADLDLAEVARVRKALPCLSHDRHYRKD